MKYLRIQLLIGLWVCVVSQDYEAKTKKPQIDGSENWKSDDVFTTPADGKGEKGVPVTTEKSNSPTTAPSMCPPKPNATEVSNVTILGLCGFPIYNDRYTCICEIDFFTDHLSECEKHAGMMAFGIFVAFLGLTIIILNSLLPIVVWQRSDMRTQYDFIKVSLSFADMISGFLLLTAVIPNMIWVRNSSESEVVVSLSNDVNSPTAIIVGSLVTMSGQASLFHLLFLSIERFIAIKWPFWHLLRKTKTIAATLCLIWTLSLLCAFVPAEFPKYFEYTFQPSLLIHYMTLKKIRDEMGNEQLGIHLPIYTTTTMIFPYAIMLIICILTGVESHKTLRQRTKTFKENGVHYSGAHVSQTKGGAASAKGSNHKQKFSIRNKLRPEVSVFITIVTMISGFTLTILPLGIVLILFVAGTLNCGTYTVPFVLTFYTGLANGFINPVIYSFRDERFKTAVIKIFRSEPMKRGTTATAITNCSKNSNSKA